MEDHFPSKWVIGRFHVNLPGRMFCSTKKPAGKTATWDRETSPYPTNLHSLKLTARAPENRPSQKESSFPTINFQVLC